MEVLSYEHFGVGDLIARLRRVRLQGFGRPLVYAHADLALVRGVDPDDLAPAQNYVLSPRLDAIASLRTALAERSIDLFALDGWAMITTDAAPQERIPVLPPIIEVSTEPDGRVVWLINDGIHRVAVARRLGLTLDIVLASKLPPEYPYYAFPRETGWEGIDVMEELPDVYEKKSYRRPSNYQALYRDFNEVFPGVQELRKQSNPDTLTP
jgi:hypothetical protein